MRLSRLILTAAALLAAALVVSCTVRQRFLEDHFADVAKGMPSTQVMAALGGPTSVTRCGEAGGEILAQCAREFVYSDPLAPLIPRYYVVSFGKDGRVLSTSVLTSP
jgi:HAMP domain-containing protein